MKPKIRDKRWSKELEEPIRRAWKAKGVFGFNHRTGKPVFSIDTPPPYVDAPVHIGQAVTYTIMDFIARFKRMKGFEVLFPLGLDRNGLPIEMAVEKKFRVSLQDTPREKFISLCHKLLEKSSLESLESFYKLGHSYTSWKHGEGIGELYYTDSDSYRRTTQETFIDLWKQGMIYEAKRISNYCPGCRTTIADAEIVYKDIPTDFVHVRWRVRETGETVTIATTRPELICTCAMVIYNPRDERYRRLKGMHAVLPIYGREVPIKPHPSAKMETGSGLAMMCSFGDYTDIRFFREMKLKPKVAINRDGRMNEHAGFLAGLGVEDARKRMIDTLRSQGLIEKEKKVMHRTPVCERSKDPIEFVPISEYYLKQLGMKKDIVKRVADRTKFFSPRSKQILLDWIDTLSMDWAVSRRRYYATEIPLWYCKTCNETIVPPKGRYYQPWREKSPVKECPRCGGKEFEGETRVFDTWFDSSISPLYVLGYGRDDRFFRKSLPCSLRPQGKEIVRTWLYYTLLRSYQLTKKPVFENVWIHYHVLDEKGNKMSKSLGNVIDPLDVVKRFGAEPLRIWCALEGNITLSDLRCSYERIEGASKFLTKLWNIARFVSAFPNRSKTKPTLLETDKWVLKEMNRIVKETGECYENFDFHRPVSDLKHFIWETFASHYLELVKSRAYNQEGSFTKGEQAAAIRTLYEVLEKILLLLAPVIPFITRKLYKDLFGKIIEEQGFPRPEKRLPRMGFRTGELLELNSRIWKAKKDKGLSLKSPIKKATVPRKFRGIEKDLREAHNIENLEYGDKLKIRL